MEHAAKFIILIFSFLQLNSVFGQQQICLDLRDHFGTTFLHFDGSQNGLENISPFINQNSLFAGVKYKIGKHLEFGFHVFDQKSKWKFANNQGISMNNGDYIKMETQSTVQVQAFSGNMGFHFPLKNMDKIEWIISSGYQFGKVKPIKGTSEFSYNEPEITIIQENTKKKYSSAFIESGFCFKIGKRIDLNTYLGYNNSFNPVYECSYNLQTNNIIENTQIKSNASGIYLGTSISFTLINIKKTEKKKRFVPEFDDKNEVTTINGRKVKPSRQVNVKNTSVQVQVWDYGKIDGDKISLFINDLCLLKKYKLTRKKKLIEVNLKPGLNKLIVYAHNLGTDPPNTAAVVIMDGTQKHVISLESNLGECGAAEIYCGE
jgi:hypothetical protein